MPPECASGSSTGRHHTWQAPAHSLSKDAPGAPHSVAPGNASETEGNSLARRTAVFRWCNCRIGGSDSLCRFYARVFVFGQRERGLEHPDILGQTRPTHSSAVHCCEEAPNSNRLNQQPFTYPNPEVPFLHPDFVLFFPHKAQAISAVCSARLCREGVPGLPGMMRCCRT